MSLSEQEQQALRQIEESLLAEDPKFGSSVSEDDSSFTGFGEGGGVTLRGVALAVVGLVAPRLRNSVFGISLSALSVSWLCLAPVFGCSGVMEIPVVSFRRLRLRTLFPHPLHAGNLLMLSSPLVVMMASAHWGTRWRSDSARASMRISPGGVRP